MSFFGVTKEVVKSIKEHKNANKLNLCELEGMAFQFVIGKDSPYKEGDTVLYFPIDSLLPIEVMRALNLIKKDEQGNELFDVKTGAPITMLSGKNGNRVKTVRLRGEVSQGLIGPVSLFDGDIETATSEEITKALGIEKYEPPVIFDANADLVPLPTGLSQYDIEGADRYTAVLDKMMRKMVTITEKLEGSNFSVSYEAATDSLFVNQRNYSIRPKEGAVHSYWKIAEDQGLLDFIMDLYRFLEDKAMQDCNVTPRMVTAYGEFCGPGVQGNLYGLQDHKVFLFDIKVDELYIPSTQFLNYCEGRQPIAPVVAENVMLQAWLAEKTIQEMSNGTSQLANVMREGIVVKPAEEEYCEELGGRLVLKQRSPEYLAKSDF